MTASIEQHPFNYFFIIMLVVSMRLLSEAKGQRKAISTVMDKRERERENKFFLRNHSFLINTYKIIISASKYMFSTIEIIMI